MPRPPRVHVAGAHYHVTLRGNHRRALFDAPGDRDRWEELLQRALDRTAATLHAYCWMTNHVHMVIQVGEAPLEGLARRVASGYARWYQQRVPTTGHLFERRYGAQLVLEDAHLLATIRYIHYNPVRAGLAATPGGYRWSSHRAYATGAGPPWLQTGRILEMFHPDQVRARRAYLAFMAETPAVAPAAAEAPPPAPPAAPSPPALPRLDLPVLAARVAADHGLTLEALCSATRLRRHARVRAIVAVQATASGCATLAEVARLFGRTASVIAQSMATLRNHEASGPASTAGGPRRPVGAPQQTK